MPTPDQLHLGALAPVPGAEVQGPALAPQLGLDPPRAFPQERQVALVHLLHHVEPRPVGGDVGVQAVRVGDLPRDVGIGDALTPV